MMDSHNSADWSSKQSVLLHEFVVDLRKVCKALWYRLHYHYNFLIAVDEPRVNTIDLKAAGANWQITTDQALEGRRFYHSLASKTQSRKIPSGNHSKARFPFNWRKN